MAHRRLQVELRQLMKTSEKEYLSVGPVNDHDLFKWRAYLLGPKDSPYHGGIFELDIKFSTEYPFKPPNVTFKTKIFHPNISSTGAICVDILQDQWSPAMTISSLLISLSSLLEKPNPEDPLSIEAADLLNQNPTRYNQKAAEWTQIYAQVY